MSPVLRRLPPVHSAIAARALSRGVAAVAGRLDPGVADQVTAELCRRYQGLEVLLVDSGTSALRLALSAVVGESSPVAVPAYGCYDIASAVIGARRRALLYHLDPGTLGPELASLRDAIRAGASAVVVAHLFGYPVDVPEVAAACASTGALLIEDAAQAAGGMLRGKPLGSFGALSVLSFGRGKGMTAGGGGALLAHDERGRAVLARARALVGPPERGTGNLVKLTAQWILGRPALYGIPAAIPFLHLGETVYRPARPPRGIPRASLAVLAHLLEHPSREPEARRRNARRLLPMLDGSALQPVGVVDQAEPGYLRLAVLHAPGTGPIDSGGRRLGIARSYPALLSELEPFQGFVVNREPGSVPGARTLPERLVTLPTHDQVGESDFLALERWIRSGR